MENSLALTCSLCMFPGSELRLESGEQKFLGQVTHSCVSTESRLPHGPVSSTRHLPFL